MWPDSADERASANLRSALWRLRGLRRLPIPLIETSHTQLRLAAGVAVDARELAERATAVLRGTRVAGPDDARRLIASADLLPGWYEDWLVFERERFRQLQLHALEALSRLLAASGGNTRGAGMWIVMPGDLSSSLMLTCLARDRSPCG